MLLPSLIYSVMVKMSDSIDDPWAYTNLTDHVVQQILASPDAALSEVRVFAVSCTDKKVITCMTNVFLI